MKNSGETSSPSSDEGRQEQEDEDEDEEAYPELVLLEEGGILERTVSGGRNDLGEAETLYYVGDVLVRMGEFDRALDHYNESIRIRKLRLGYKNRLVAESYKSIGNVYNLTGRPVEADACYVEALRSLRKRKGSNFAAESRTAGNAESDNLLISVLRLRGHIKAQAGEAEEAISILCWCLDIQKSSAAVGPDHPDVADALWARASLYLDVCRDDAATADFWEALRIRKACYGDEHPAVGDTLHDMGMIMWRKGDAESAVELLSEALWIRRRCCGGEDEDEDGGEGGGNKSGGGGRDGEDASESRLKEAETQAALAVIHRKMGRTDSALQMYEGCLKLRRMELGAEHEKVADVHVALGHAYGDVRNYSEARRHFLAGLSILDKSKERSSDSRFVQLLYLLGKTEFKDGRIAAAQTYLERFVQYRNKQSKSSSSSAHSAKNDEHVREIDYVKAMCMLGKISHRTGDKRGARERIAVAQKSYALSDLGSSSKNLRVGKELVDSMMRLESTPTSSDDDEKEKVPVGGR